MLVCELQRVQKSGGMSCFALDLLSAFWHTISRIKLILAYMPEVEDVMIDWFHWLIYLNSLASWSVLLLILWFWPSLADRIRHIRYERGWTQAKFGEYLGIDVRTVRRWEQGQQPPSARYIHKLSKLDKGFMNAYERSMNAPEKMLMDLLKMEGWQFQFKPVYAGQRASGASEVDIIATDKYGAKTLVEFKMSRRGPIIIPKEFLNA